MAGGDEAAHEHAHDPAHSHPAQAHDRDDHLDHNHGDHAHDHDSHEHDHGRFGWLRDWLPFGHGHSHGETTVDVALESSERGLRALRISLLGLLVTAVIQLVIVLISGSAGLLADTIHNFADALTAVPLWIAFVLGRRPANRRYTYGYGRAEDVAGVLIVAIILISALVALWESVQKLRHPETIGYLGWVMAAAVIGFIGNELIATYRIRVGTEIGSAALVADGQHARADGFTSLAVLIGAIGVALGFPLADPLVGVLITIAILFIVKETATLMWQRLMDAVDPALVENLEQTAAALPGVQAAHDARLRWLGHRLQAELHIMVDEDLPTWESHQIVEEVRHALFHAEPRLEAINIHVDPCGHGGHDPHALTAHHARPRTA